MKKIIFGILALTLLSGCSINTGVDKNETNKDNTDVKEETKGNSNNKTDDIEVVDYKTFVKHGARYVDTETYEYDDVNHKVSFVYSIDNCTETVCNYPILYTTILVDNKIVSVDTTNIGEYFPVGDWTKAEVDSYTLKNLNAMGMANYEKNMDFIPGSNNIIYVKNVTDAGGFVFLISLDGKLLASHYPGEIGIFTLGEGGNLIDLFKINNDSVVYTDVYETCNVYTYSIDNNSKLVSSTKDITTYYGTKIYLDSGAVSTKCKSHVMSNDKQFNE